MVPGSGFGVSRSDVPTSAGLMDKTMLKVCSITFSDHEL
jgi:hypothetical protein